MPGVRSRGRLRDGPGRLRARRGGGASVCRGERSAGPRRGGAGSRRAMKTVRGAVAAARLLERRAASPGGLPLAGAAAPLRRGPERSGVAPGSRPPAGAVPVLRRRAVDRRPAVGIGRRWRAAPRSDAPCAARSGPSAGSGVPAASRRIRRSCPSFRSETHPDGAHRGLRDLPPLRQVHRPHRRRAGHPGGGRPRVARDGPLGARAGLRPHRAGAGGNLRSSAELRR